LLEQKEEQMKHPTQHTPPGDDAESVELVTPKPRAITIPPPRFEEAIFEIVGSKILVIHRMSEKLKKQFEKKQELGRAGNNRKDRAPKSSQQSFNESRYRSVAGWDGFQASAIRNALISACRLCGYKMTLAKMSIFAIADGQDRDEPQIDLIRIFGTPKIQKDMARVATGEPYVTVRASYSNWRAKVRLRWDAEQFTAEDISNLLMRVGQQVGIGEGRPDSKNSAGMGWGLFNVGKHIEMRAIA
jgi:hypothetical protein